MGVSSPARSSMHAEVSTRHRKENPPRREVEAATWAVLEAIHTVADRVQVQWLLIATTVPANGRHGGTNGERFASVSTKRTAASQGRGGGQVGRPASMRGTANLRTSSTPEGDRLMTRGQRTKPPSGWPDAPDHQAAESG